MKSDNRIADSRILARKEKLCLAAGLIVASLLAAGLALWLGLQQDYRPLEQRALAIQREVAVRVASADVVLTSLTGIHRASDVNRPYQFLDLAHELLSAYRFIRAISKADLVPAKNRTEWERRLQSSGFPTARIAEYRKSAGIVTAGPRARYFPIRFLEPLEPETARLLGFDIASHPAVRSALAHAVDTGGVGTSDIFPFPNGGKGWLFMKAVYLGHIEPQTVDQRRRQLAGLVVLHIDMRDLIRGVASGFADTEIVLTDGHNKEAVNQPVRHADFALWTLPTISASQPLDLNGKPYLLQTRYQPTISGYKLALLFAFVAFTALTGLALISAHYTQRKNIRQNEEAARRLRENEKRFRDYAEVASDWYWSMDAGLRFDFISDRMRTITGIDPSQFIGKTRSVIAPDDPEMRARIAANNDDMKARRSFRDFQYSSDHDPERTCWFSVSGKPVFSETGDFVGYRGTARDITPEVEAREQIFQAKESAERANRVKSEFLATMSHELRTPLNAIIGFSEVLKGQLLGPVGNARYLEYANDIHGSGQHLLALINDVLDLSKIDSGKDAIAESVFEVAVVVESVRSLVQPRAYKGGVVLEIDICEDLPTLRADERKIKQILVNLLMNAIKFTDRGGKVSLRVWCRIRGGFIFQIADNGIGIAPEDIQTVFAKFGQLDSGMSRRYEGTGLGLPLTKALVEQHGGVLDLESEVGVGTTVTVYLPTTRTMQPRGQRADLRASTAAS